MFWDKVAWAYDLFANVLNRKADRALCAAVEVQSGNKGYWFRYDENGEIVGGIAKFVVPLCRRPMIYDRDLIIKGLVALYWDNVRRRDQ